MIRGGRGEEGGWPVTSDLVISEPEEEEEFWSNDQEIEKKRKNERRNLKITVL